MIFLLFDLLVVLFGFWVLVFGSGVFGFWGGLGCWFGVGELDGELCAFLVLGLVGYICVEGIGEAFDDC